MKKKEEWKNGKEIDFTSLWAIQRKYSKTSKIKI